MVKLRKSKNKLKIILCCILGFIVAVGGVIGILVLAPLMEGEKEPTVVDSAVNEKNDPGDMTYEQHAAAGDDGYRTITYLAYVLAEQPYYHSQSATVSVAPFNMTQYTNSFKDYKDGIMVSSDLTYGIKNAGTQAAFVPDGDEEGRGAGVYMRTSSGTVGADSTGTSVSWKDDVVYYDRESYLHTYGEYSTEMTVYLLTEETITSWDPAEDNGDGTYTQTFYLDAEKACYYYQYAMQTRGGLLMLPVFKDITLDVTFDNNYRVLQIDAVENSRINPFTWMDSTSTTTTYYTYGEENFDQPHYDYYEDFFKQYVGQLGSVGGDDGELTPLDLLMNAFAGVLNGEGQQFDAVVQAGGKPYYGRVYLNLDINGITSGDILGSIEARIALSADENIDEQDLYISFGGGSLQGYYSPDFALTADVNELSDVISQFESWAQGIPGASSGDYSAEGAEGEDGGEGFSLDELLQQFTNGVTEERDGGLTYTASLEVSGISLDAVFDFSAQGSGESVTYSLNTAQIGGISYNGSPVELTLELAPSSSPIISHEEAEAPFDLSAAAQSIYELVNSKTVAAEISLEGEKLADFIASLGITDLGASLDDLSLTISGAVDLSGITVAASAELYDLNAGRTLLAADVHYVYNEGAGRYGTAYLNISNILGAQTSAKVYCDISELASTIETLVERFGSSEEEGAEGAAAAAEEGDSIASLINGILGLDFGSVIEEVTAGTAVIGATVDIDSVLALLGADISLGEITLEYRLGDFDREDYNNAGGWLYGSIPSLGAEAYIYGSNTALSDAELDDYLDLNAFIGSAVSIIDSPVVNVELELSGKALADVLGENDIAELGSSLDSLVLEIEGSVSISDLNAQLALNLYDKNKVYLAADAYYEYDGEGYGVAYINLTRILGARYTGVKVYCDIAELASAAEWLVADATADGGPEEGAQIADIITDVLSIDLGGIVKELGTTADGLSATVDLGGILAQFTEADIDLGELTLEYSIGEDGGLLSGSALGGGLTMSVTGADGTIAAPDTEEYYNLTALINSIYEIFDSNTIRVLLDITGGTMADILAENGITGADELLAGTNIHISGNIDIDTLAVKGAISFSGADKTYFAADVFYRYDEAGYGDVYLNITKLLGAECGGIKIYGNIGQIISSVEDIFGMIAVGTSGSAASSREVSQVADIVSRILSINLGSIVRGLRIDQYGVVATVNVDYLLGSLAGIDLGVGDMFMLYDGHFLEGTAMNGGLELLLYGSEMYAYGPNASAYLNVNSLLELVANAKDAVQDIIDKHSVHFVIKDARLTADGVTFGVSGEGEAVWNKESGALEQLALGLKLSMDGADGTSENTVKLIYNAVAADNEPLVQLAINNVGLIITQNDIDQFGSDINTLVSRITELLGGSSEDPQGGLTGNDGDTQLIATLSEGDGSEGDVSAILKLILGIFNDEYDEGTVGNKLGELLGGLLDDVLGGSVSIEKDEQSDNDLLKITVGDVTVTFGAGNGLTLSGSAANIGSFNVGVAAGTGYTPDTEGVTFYSSAAGGNSDGSFTRAIYNFIFGAYEGVDIGSFLGGDTYSVEIKLNGANSDIEALKGVTVNANLCFTASKDDGAATDRKIAKADITVTASGFTFAADVIFSGDTLYITLTEINGTEFNIGLKASTDNIYRAVENLIKIVQNDKVIGLVSGLIGGQGATTPDIGDIAAYSDTTSSPEGDSVADLISAILKFNYGEIITVAGSDAGSFVASLNIDKLLNALNVNEGTPVIGNATLKLADESGQRGIYFSVANENKSAWLTVNAGRSEGNNITVPADYIDIGFVADLIDDVNKFVSSREDMLYTFTGDITIGVTVLGFINLEISISEISLTLGVNESGQFYVSIVGKLSGNLVEESTIGATFCNNLITLARDIDTANELYWIMTPEYFVDHMFDKTPGNDMFPDSPLHWLTRMSLWNTLAGILQENVDINSGAGSPEEWYLYNNSEATTEAVTRESGQPISIMQYVTSFMASIGNNSYSFNGDSSVLGNLAFDDVTSGYYVASLNAGALTDNIVNTIDIGIARDNNNGIKSLNAYLALSQYVDITAHVDLKYDRTESAVVNHFNSAVSAANELMGEDYEFDFNAKDDVGYAQSAFGSVKVEKYGDDLAYDYTYTYVDDYHTAIVHMADGSTQTRKLRYGSTIYLYDSANPDPDGDGYIIAYEAQDGTIYPQVVLDNEQPTTYEFTARLIKLNETVNGVVYTFVGSTSNIVDENGVHIPHYKITSASLDKKYTRTENPETLVLENEINGLPVGEIIEGAFEGKLLKKIVIPENITYIGAEAFKDNYGMISAVFLADTVTMAGSGKTYPFYGCSASQGSNDTRLTVYFNTVIYSNGMEDSNSSTYRSNSSTGTSSSPDNDWRYFREKSEGFIVYNYTYYYLPSYGAGAWSYIEYDVKYAEGSEKLGISNEQLFAGLPFVTTTDITDQSIDESTVIANINAYTADNCDYINGYNVEGVHVEQADNRATVTVTLAETEEQERYYAADSLEISYTVEGSDTDLDLFEITYADYQLYGAEGRIFVKADSKVKFTLKQEFADYYSFSKVSGNIVNDNSYEFNSMTEAMTEVINCGNIALDFEVIGNYVTVYSDISFTYGGATYNGNGAANQMLVGASVSELGSPSTTQSGYYFLGWATKGNNGLEFNSVVADNATYYAIWVNSSRGFNSIDTSSGSDLPDLTSTTDGIFAGWYGENFRNTTAAKISGINEIPENKTTVYARWSFTVTLSGSNATITSNNQTSGSFMAEEGSTVAFTVKYDYDDSQGFSVKDSKGNDVTYELSNNQYQFSMPPDNVEIKASSENCITAGSLITLSDGSQKKVEDLTGDELLLVWNLETGTFDTAPIVFIDSDAECEYEIINLIFSDGTEVKVISEHAFWDYDLNEYVYLDRYAGKYIGHWFNKQTTDEVGNFANTAVQLTDVVITYEVTTAYSPVTYGHLCYYVNGMLSMPGGISGLFNIFEVDPDTMMYDREAMEADIAEYGLFTYEDFEGLVSEEVFEAFNGKYLKVAMGKGMLTWDDIVYLVERYSQFF